MNIKRFIDGMVQQGWQRHHRTIEFSKKKVLPGSLAALISITGCSPESVIAQQNNVGLKVEPLQPLPVAVYMPTDGSIPSSALYGRNLFNGRKQTLDYDPKFYENYENMPSHVDRRLYLKFPERNSSLVSNLRAVFKDSYFDFFPNHNQMIAAIKHLLESKKIPNSQPFTLIHFDSHADMYGEDYTQTFKEGLNGTGLYQINGINVGGTTIANFINALASAKVVNEIYWIVPTAIYDQVEKGSAFYMGSSPETQTIFRRKKDGVLFFQTHQPDGNGEYKSTNPPEVLNSRGEIDKGKFNIITFHRLPSDRLKDINPANPLIFSLDVDGFGSTDFKVPIASPEQVMSDFQSLIADLRHLEDKGHKVVYTGFSLSKDYLNNPWLEPLMTRLAVLIAENSKAPNTLANFVEDLITTYADNTAYNGRIPIHQRTLIDVPTNNNPSTQLLWSLVRLDAHTPEPDLRIYLNSQTPNDLSELEKAIDLVRRYFPSLNDRQAKEYLRKLSYLVSVRGGYTNPDQSIPLTSQTVGEKGRISDDFIENTIRRLTSPIGLTTLGLIQPEDLTPSSLDRLVKTNPVIDEKIKILKRFLEKGIVVLEPAHGDTWSVRTYECRKDGVDYTYMKIYKFGSELSIEGGKSKWRLQGVPDKDWLPYFAGIVTRIIEELNPDARLRVTSQMIEERLQILANGGDVINVEKALIILKSNSGKLSK